MHGIFCPSICAMLGRVEFSLHDQVLRYHSVGRTCRTAETSPRLQSVIWTRMSSGPALAYSTKTSMYSSLLKTPVSMSSYSGCVRLRPRLVATISSYGKADCGYLYRYFMYECVGVLSR